MYQLVIFDWDGTIMDSAHKIANCIKASAREVGVDEPTDEAAKSIIGLGLTEAMTVLFPALSTDKVAQIVEAYRYQFVTADATQQVLFAGVEQGLQTLSDTGALLAVATGKSRAGLDRVFAELDINRHFVASRCADETRSKPHPQMLHELLEFTALEPQQCIMVGDTTYDMDMAANAGMHALGVGYGVHSEQQLLDSKAVTVLPSFNSVVDWLSDGRLQEAYAEQ